MTKRTTREEADQLFDQLFKPANHLLSKRSPPAKPPSYLITHIYTVRESWGGPRKYIEVKTPTISMTEAQLNVARVLREGRYVEEVLIEVIRQ